MENWLLVLSILLSDFVGGTCARPIGASIPNA
jgi:hypothetical protein